jgi:ABC-type dipeptide/oligopeptide/nickel transport system permease subunit
MSATTADALPQPLLPAARRPGGIRALGRFARHKPLGAFGALLVLVFLAIALCAPVLTRYNPTRGSGVPLQPPSAEHWFGTDSLGRDVYSRVVQGSQISLSVGLVVTAVTVTVSTLLGMLAGYYGRWPDYLIQRSGEVFSAFPGLILYFLIIAAFGRPQSRGGNLLTIAWDLRVLIFALSLQAFFGGSRLIRGQTLSLKQSEFVAAARALGASDPRLILRHLLPNVAPLVIVTATAGVGAVILSEAALSFLGLGVSPGTPSWGADLSGRNRAFFIDAPWMALAPGLAISLTVLGLNLFGDALRDVLDPRLRGSRGR